MLPQRDWLFVGCEGGHDMQSIGGCNAGCHDLCGCSVPVHTCTRCGACDYGENEEAKEIRSDCVALHGAPQDRFVEDHDCDMEHMRCDRCDELIEECGRSGLCDECFEDENKGDASA